MKFDQISGFKGLFIQPNSFELPKGALEIAENVVIEDRDTVNKCRGFYEYYEYTADDQEIINITSFDDHLLSMYSTFMAYYDDVGTAPNITGTKVDIPQDSAVDISYSVIDTANFEQANGNLYTTTDQGVIKLSSYDGTLYQSGAPQGLDLNGSFALGEAASWWDIINLANAPAITVGYRILFGYEDPNNNLILGAPSSILSFTNQIVTVVAADINLSAYPVVTITSANHGLQNGNNVTFFDAEPANAADAARLQGSFVISNVTANTFDYTATAAGPVANDVTKIKYILSEQPRLEFSVPTQITSTTPGWFFQLYRSSQQSSEVGIIGDYRLIDQRELTAQEISDLVVFYNDGKSELFKGENLYTNQNSGEGELQANFRAPQCKNMTLYQSYLFYGNCRTRHLLDFSVIDPADFTGGYLEIKVGDWYRRYYAHAFPANYNVRATAAAGTVTYNSHGINAATITQVYLSNADGTLADGYYYAQDTGGNTFRFADSVADYIAAAWNAGGGATHVDFEVIWEASTTTVAATWVRADNVVTVTSAAHGLLAGTGIVVQASGGATPITFAKYTITDVIDPNTFTFAETAADDSGNMGYSEVIVFSLDSSTISGATDAEQIRDMAQNLVKAINRDPDSKVYAQYVSTPIDTPGNMRLQAKGFGEPIYLRVFDDSVAPPNPYPIQGAFFPIIPTSYASGLQVFSADELKQNAVYFSKLSEPEAVPLVNFIPVGSSKAEILAIHALTNSIIIIKSDGIFRLSGDNPSNFVVSLLDGTVKGVASRSSDTFANQVSLLSNQGICLVSETSVQIVSRPIENVIQNVVQLGSIELSTSAVSYEIERQYIITTQDPQGDTVTYCYNILTDAWSTWTWNFSESCVGPDSRLYMVDESRKIITRERKDNQKTDYSGQNYSITVIDASDPQVVLIQSNTYDIKYGDAITKDGVINIVSGVVLYSPGQYLCSFFYPTNLSDADSLQIYASYDATIKLAPYTAGQVGVQKQFSQIQAHFKNYSCTALDISFTSDSYNDSKVIEWVYRRLINGWGTFPWGLDYWGQVITDKLSFKTHAAPVARVYTSRQAQRSTFFQPQLVNRIAGDRINLQSVNVAVRSYGERVSR